MKLTELQSAMSAALTFDAQINKLQLGNATTGLALTARICGRGSLGSMTILI